MAGVLVETRMWPGGVPNSLPFGSFISHTTCTWLGIITKPQTTTKPRETNSCQDKIMISLYLSGFRSFFQSFIVSVQKYTSPKFIRELRYWFCWCSMFRDVLYGQLCAKVCGDTDHGLQNIYHHSFLHKSLSSKTKDYRLRIKEKYRFYQKNL